MEPITGIFLSIFGKNYRVLNYNYSFRQPYNETTGTVVGRPIGGVVDISIISDGETDIFEWMVETTDQQEGAIEFYSGDELVRSISFEDAFLVGYHQNLDKITDIAGNMETVVSEDLTISYRVLDFEGVAYDKEAMQNA